MSAPIIAVDHFAGLGWGVACERLGIREYGVEIAPSAIRMRSANRMRTIYRDVWTGLFNSEMVPEHDLYIASPPCQTFSIAGRGEGRKALDDVLGLIDRRAYTSGWLLEYSARNLDPRTALVLTPLAHIWQHRPRLVALEQVPAVLPVWHAYAAVLRSIGYSVWAGNLQAEQYGVPQTRKRAILMARLDGKVEPPAPTHSRYYSTNPGRLDPGVGKWVSMAEALGSDAALRSNYSDGATGDRGYREPHEPSMTITSKGDRMKWVARKAMGAGMVERHGDRPGRTLDQPEFTIRGDAGGMEPGGFAFRQELMDYASLDAPAPTIAADSRVAPRGCKHIAKGCCAMNRDGELTRRQFPEGSLRLTHLEAAALQSFPRDMVWPGNKGERFLAIGNAVPPLLAEVILAVLIAPPAERDAWELASAEVDG